MSDQQLVTGLALLIGAVAQISRISVYEFSVAVALAWFSSTTHLATLNVLREYFLQNSAILKIRVGGMLLILVLTSFTQAVSLLSGELYPGVAYQCILCPDELSQDFDADVDSIGFLEIVISILALIFAYFSAILSLRSRSDNVRSLTWLLGSKHLRRFL